MRKYDDFDCLGKDPLLFHCPSSLVSYDITCDLALEQKGLPTLFLESRISEASEQLFG